MRIITLFLLFSAFGRGQVIPTPFFWPTGSSANTSQVFADVPNNCGTWLGPDATRMTQDASGAVRSGCYFTGKYHLGYDILNLPGVMNQEVYAIADAVVVGVSYGPGAPNLPANHDGGWGTTTCIEATTVTGVTPPECGTLIDSANVALIMRSKKIDGSYFYWLVGHLINANYNPQTLVGPKTIQAATTRRVFNVNDVFLAGQQVGVTGNWTNHRHVHFSVFPYTKTTSPLGRETLTAANWPDSPTQHNYTPTGNLQTDGTYFNQLNPINWIINNRANNYLSFANATIPHVVTSTKTTTLTVSPGGIGILTSQLQSALKFSGTAQNTITSPANILWFSDAPQVLSANSTVPIQNLIYVPPTTPLGTYPVKLNSVFQDKLGNLGGSMPVTINLQVASPPATAFFAAITSPSLTALGTAGGLMVGTKFTVYVAGSAIDPNTIQATLSGIGCSGNCVGTKVAASPTAYVGTFTAPSKPGNYQLRLRNGTGFLSNALNLTVYAPLTASCSASAPSVPINTNVTFTGIANGGLEPYSYNWEDGATGTGSSVTTSYASGGYLAAVDLDVTDYLGNTVHAPCGVQVQLGQPTITLFGVFGQAIAGAPFDGALAGTNLGSNLEVWFCQDPADTVCYQQPNGGVHVLDDAEVDLPTINLSAGSWRAKIRNGPAGKFSNLSNSFAVAPSSATQLTASCQVSSPQITAGSNATFTGKYSGGTSPFSEGWYSTNAGKIVNTGTVSMLFPSPGTFVFTYKVTDSTIPPQSKSVDCSIKVVAAPSLTGGCSISPSTIVLAQGATVTATASGGQSPYQYLLGTSGTWGTNSTIGVLPSNVGLFTYPVSIRDGAGQQISTSCSAQVVSPPSLMASCSFSPNPISLGNGSTLSALGSGGAGGYQFSFNGVFFSATNTQLVFPQDVGTQAGSIWVKDSSGTTASASCALTVQGVKPSVSGFSWNASPVHGVNFGGQISGSGFPQSSTTVWFCVANTNTCYQQPQAGVNVQGVFTILVSNVNLSAGSWQVQVRTPFGVATSSSSFAVQ